MLALFSYLTSWLNREDGQGMAEYGLILALVAIVVIVALTLLGTTISSVFADVAGSMP
jgi:pilus assembly protein Flp/PilA